MVRRIRERVCGLVPLRRLVYLISPNKIDKNFYSNLDKVLSYKNVKFFQLRLKNVKKNSLINISKKIKNITFKHQVKFILNDNFILASKIRTDGCHMGQLDGSFGLARKKLKKKLLGVTCHNSKTLAKNAMNYNADYVAFGSFFSTKTKKIKHYAHLNLIKWANKKLKLPVVAIGGINIKNYKIILESGANLIAMSNFIWKNNKNIKGF